MVNDQLRQFYLDLELEGIQSKLSCDESSSENSSCEEDSSNKQNKNRQHRFGNLMMIYEENSPFPPPVGGFFE